MTPGQLILVDNRPAEFLSYESDHDGNYVTYRTLGETSEHWMSARACGVRMQAPKKWRD